MIGIYPREALNVSVAPSTYLEISQSKGAVYVLFESRHYCGKIY